MKKYEMLYLIDPTVAEEAREALISRMEATVTEMNGTVVSIDKWGMKKLAYVIDYKSEAFYVLMTFESEATVVDELDRLAGLSDEILRRMITVVD